MLGPGYIYVITGSFITVTAIIALVLIIMKKLKKKHKLIHARLNMQENVAYGYHRFSNQNPDEKPIYEYVRPNQDAHYSEIDDFIEIQMRTLGIPEGDPRFQLLTGLRSH